MLNITSNTPYWVKERLYLKSILRRNRRRRKTPYRMCRKNRASSKKEGRVAPSTKARWDLKLRLIKLLSSIIPITLLNIEDIQAISLPGKPKWNKTFSPLEVGKNYFYNEITKLYPKNTLIKTKGYDTFLYRNNRNFTLKKSKNKLDYKWEAHNIDSHCLAEIALNKQIDPYLGLYKIEQLQFHRRQLHFLNFTKNSFKKKFGSTVTMGMSRGSVLKYKNKFCYLGGTSNGKISIYSIITGKRISQCVNILKINVMFNSKFRTQLLTSLRPWKSLLKFK